MSTDQLTTREPEPTGAEIMRVMLNDRLGLIVDMIIRDMPRGLAGAPVEVARLIEGLFEYQRDELCVQFVANTESDTETVGETGRIPGSRFLSLSIIAPPSTTLEEARLAIRVAHSMGMAREEEQNG